MNNSAVVLALALVMVALESSAFVVPTDDDYDFLTTPSTRMEELTNTCQRQCTLTKREEEDDDDDYGYYYGTAVVKSAVGLYVLRNHRNQTAIISSLFPLIFLIFLMSKHVRARALSLPFPLFLPLRQVCL